MDTLSKYISVSDFTDQVRLSLEKSFPRTLFLRGEISGFKPSSTGHWYFSIKDDEALINAIIFKGSQSAIYAEFLKNGVKSIKDGQEVLVEGKINIYKKSGSYSIIINAMQPLGIGGLFIKFEELKRELSSLGYFDETIKKPLPPHPKTIGIITSPTGAALQDMLNVLKRRSRGVTIKIFPVSVQGDSAKNEIVKAIQYADYQYCNAGKDAVDILIIARGGGSIEDLWSFNERIVADAIYHCQVPVVTGVGHEIDFTIADFCADLRAPTPSAAAELVAKSSDELELTVSSLHLRIQGAISSRITQERNRVNGVNALRLGRYIRSVFENRIQDHMYQSERFSSGFDRLITEQKHRYQMLDKRLLMLSPLNVLERGYSVVFSEATGKVVCDADMVSSGERLQISLSKGKITAVTV